MAEEQTGEDKIFSIKEVLGMLSKAGISDKHLADLTQKSKDAPETLGSVEQFGNALKGVVKKFSTEKFGEGARKSATKTESLLKSEFPKVDFSSATNQEEYISKLSESVSKPPEKESKSSTELSTSQIEQLDRVVALKKELETLRGNYATLEQDSGNMLKKIQSEHERIRLGSQFFNGLGPALSENPAIRNNQIKSFERKIAKIPLVRDENGNILTTADGFPMVADETGSQKFDKNTHESVSYLDTLKACSAVDFGQKRQTSSSDPSDDFRGGAGGQVVYNPTDKNFDAETLRLKKAGKLNEVNKRIAAKHEYMSKQKW